MEAVEFPCHRHPLNPVDLLPGEEEEEEEEADKEEENGVCGLCGEGIRGSRYECSICNFSAHPGCVKKLPSLVIEECKIHDHPLTLLPRHVSFTCDACGLPGDKSPYVCLSCSFMIHGDCVYTPRIIRITRHGHRLSHTFFLGPGEWNCGVCRKSIDGKYGGFRCAKEDCSYVAHSNCALWPDVWDGIELEGVPEEDEENDDGIENFERINDGIILHFGHQHHLRRGIENKDIIRDVYCNGCSSPVASNPFYMCQECDFFLHKSCASAPRKIYYFQHHHPLTLLADDTDFFICDVCDLLSSGFRYHCSVCLSDFDLRCTTVTEPFEYQLHPHPLFAVLKSSCICNVCKRLMHINFLSCIECEYHVCLACATLPAEVMYKYDEHPLSHTSGSSVPFWCDICENKIEENEHFYKCSDCGPVVHVECILARSFRNLRPGFLPIKQYGEKWELIFSDQTSLQRCRECNKDCHEPLIVMIITTTTDDKAYLCSSCFSKY